LNIEKLYKLTNKKNATKNNTLWGENITHGTDAKEHYLCSPTVIHAYRDINLAVLLNPIHAKIERKEIKIWEAIGIVVVEDWGKVGCSVLSTIREIEWPIWIKKEKDVQILFAALCAETVLHFYEKKYPEDCRPRKAIDAAKKYLEKKTQASAYAADADKIDFATLAKQAIKIIGNHS